MLDILIDRVKLLDLASGEEKLCGVGIEKGMITAVLPAETPQPQARKVIFGNGSYLFPGFIDFHTHLFQHGSGFGLDADRLLTAGVTTTVDMGTAGYANYPAFHQCDVVGKTVRIKSYLNLSPVGQPGKGINEPLEQKVLDVGAMEKSWINIQERLSG